MFVTIKNYEFKVSVIELFENGIVPLFRGEKNVVPRLQNRIWYLLGVLFKLFDDHPGLETNFTAC